MRFSIIILGLICNLLATDARYISIKGSSRSLRNNDLNEPRLLGVGEANDVVEMEGKEPKDPPATKAPRPDDDEGEGKGEGNDEDDEDEDEQDIGSLPTLSPANQPIQAPITAPVMSPTIKPPNKAIQAPVMAPVMAPTLSPANPPIQTPIAAPVMSPTLSPANPPIQTPVITPVKSPTLTPSPNQDTASYTPIIVYPETPTAPSWSPFAPTITITNPDPPSPSTPSAPAPGTPTTRPVSDPNQPTISRPSASEPGANPTTLPMGSIITNPPAVPSSNPSVAPSSSPTIMPSVATVARTLLPFDIILEGESEQFVGVEEPLTLSLEFFMETKFGEVFEGVTSVRLQEDDTAQSIQRQKVQKTFRFEGNASFQNSNAPTTQEVHRVQQSILENFLFELGGILRDNGILLDPTNVLIDRDTINTADDDIALPGVDPGDSDKEVLDEDSHDVVNATGGRGIAQDDDDDSGAGIWIGLAAALLVLGTGFFVARRRQPNDEELSVADEENLLVDTSEPQPLTWDGVFKWSSLGFEELEGNVPRPQTEFMNVPQLEKREVVTLRNVSPDSKTKESMAVGTYHQSDPQIAPRVLFDRPGTPPKDP